MKIYVDGIEQLGTNFGPQLTSIGEPIGYNFRIGRYSADPHQFYFKGLMDEVKAYNKVLTFDEINTLYGEQICSEDTWDCGDWNQCTIDGRQSRSCTKTLTVGR